MLNARTITIAELVERLKTTSSQWIKTQGADLAGFSWQRGYGCFSINPRDLPALIEYIDNQDSHHATRTFEEEYRMFLNRYGLKYDEAYVWD